LMFKSSADNSLSFKKGYPSMTSFSFAAKI